MLRDYKEAVRNLEVVSKPDAAGDYWSVLKTDYQRFAADTNNDDKIDRGEYKAFLIKDNEPVQHTKTVIQKVDPIEAYTAPVFMLVGMVCITVIIISLIRKKKVVSGLLT